MFMFDVTLYIFMFEVILWSWGGGVRVAYING